MKKLLIFCLVCRAVAADDYGYVPFIQEHGESTLPGVVRNGHGIYEVPGIAVMTKEEVCVVEHDLFTVVFPQNSKDPIGTIFSPYIGNRLKDAALTKKEICSSVNTSSEEVCRPISSSSDEIDVKNADQSATDNKTEFARVNLMTKQTTGIIHNIVFTRLNDQIYKTRIVSVNDYWTKAFGSYQQRPGSDMLVRTNSTVGGVIVGVDNRYNDSVFFGAYIGGIKGKITIGDSANQVINGTGMTIGGYSSIKFNNDRFLVLNLGLGYVYNKSNNSVYNNSIIEDIEHNHGAYNEFYFAPSATFGKYIEYANFTIIPSVTINYIVQYLSGDKEKGGRTAQTVGSWSANTIGGIGQITVQKTYDYSTDKSVNIAINLGVEVTKMINSRKINATTIGKSTFFNAVDPKQYIDLISGLSVNRNITKGINVFASTNFAKGMNPSSKHNYKITLDAGVEIKF